MSHVTLSIKVYPYIRLRPQNSIGNCIATHDCIATPNTWPNAWPPQWFYFSDQRPGFTHLLCNLRWVTLSFFSCKITNAKISSIALFGSLQKLQSHYWFFCLIHSIHMLLARLFRELKPLCMPLGKKCEFCCYLMGSLPFSYLHEAAPHPDLT